MKLAPLAILLMLAGCAVVRFEGDGWWATALTFLKEPKPDSLKLNRRGVGVGDYDGISKADGKDLSSIISDTTAAIIKVIP